MAYRTVSLAEIKKQYNKYVESLHVDSALIDENYLKIRNFCLKEYNEIKELAKSKTYGNSEKYTIDLLLGIKLYEFLNQQESFNAKYESNYSFWRYLATIVIPDIVSDRWKIDKSAHFFSKPTAIYPFQIYWYIKLSWQGTIEETIEILKDNQEDHILQLVDRPSSIGVNVDLYRKIMKKLTTINPKERKNKFRIVMMKNTSKLVNIRPEIYPGGLDAYVDMLYANI